LLFPESKRKYIYAIYAFARTADDIADSEKFTSREKIEKLNLFELVLNKNDISLIDNNNNYSNVFTALFDTIEKFKIPRVEFLNLLSAFKQDAVKDRYNNFNELLQYSKFSANPIGHLVLVISGYKSEDLFRMSDCICTGLQLINFWQDVKKDLEINRIYIPEDIMRKYNYDEYLLSNNAENEDFIKMMKELVDKTYDIFKGGFDLKNHLNGRLKYEFKAIVTAGMYILNNIKKLNYKVLTNDISVSNINKLTILLKAIL